MRRKRPPSERRVLGGTGSHGVRAWAVVALHVAGCARDPRAQPTVATAMSPSTMAPSAPSASAASSLPARAEPVDAARCYDGHIAPKGIVKEAPTVTVAVLTSTDGLEASEALRAVCGVTERIAYCVRDVARKRKSVVTAEHEITFITSDGQIMLADTDGGGIADRELRDCMALIAGCRFPPKGGRARVRFSIRAESE